MAKRTFLWCDAEANCRRLSDRAGVKDIVSKARRAGIDTLIVDVKPLSGQVLYSSKFAPRLGEVNGVQLPDNFDLLAAMIEEGHAQGLEVHAAVNVFSEGHRQWGRGPAFEHPEWQVTMYEPDRTATIGDRTVRVDYTDPWEPKAAPTVYTCKIGPSLKPQSEKTVVVIEGDRVSDVITRPSGETPIPAEGCVLVLPGNETGIEAGDQVSWHVRPIFRCAAESRLPSFGIFVNPIGPVREHELRIIDEIVSGYDIDGITFDRMRYPNLYGDFSDASREAFEAWLGRGAIQWPEDIFAMSEEPWKPPKPGRYYNEWLEWRARQIRSFAGKAVDLCRKTRPGMEVGVYVGSWYDCYYDVGVNWGSCGFHAGYSWMTEEYHEAGYAELFDYLCTGCYYPVPTRKEAAMCGRPQGATVEAACELSGTAIAGAASFYGSVYLLDYRDKPDVFRHAIEVCLDKSDGVMLFDLVYLEDYGWWPVLEETLGNHPRSG